MGVQANEDLISMMSQDNLVHSDNYNYNLNMSKMNQMLRGQGDKKENGKGRSGRNNKIISQGTIQGSGESVPATTGQHSDQIVQQLLLNVNIVGSGNLSQKTEIKIKNYKDS